MNTQNLIRLLLRQELNHALGVEVRLSARVCQERELSNVVLYAGRFEVLFRFTDPSDLRVGIHNGRYGIVVDMTVTCF